MKCTECGKHIPEDKAVRDSETGEVKFALCLDCLRPKVSDEVYEALKKDW